MAEGGRIVSPWLEQPPNSRPKFGPFAAGNKSWGVMRGYGPACQGANKNTDSREEVHLDCFNEGTSS